MSTNFTAIFNDISKVLFENICYLMILNLDLDNLLLYKKKRKKTPVFHFA